ncbi:MAG: Gfo/Idh/MocA family oxidoreductase [Planctomycetota bacterium]|nr:Gfo/Idh/MocA family oxidoreductase [Planctomycetota bacterium]
MPITRRSFVKTVGAAGAAALTARMAAPADKKKITLGFVGCAHIHTPMFITALKTREDVTVKAVWDHDAARAAKRAGELGAKAVKDAAEIWGDTDIAGVVIASETGRHAELVAAAAKAKKHIFVEKPLGVGAKDATEMADAVEKAGVLFTTGYALRIVPQHIFIKEHVAKGNFGTLVRAHCSFCNECVLQGAFDDEFKWTVDAKCGALGGFADVGTHALDMLMWLLGDVEAVSADIRSVTGRYKDCDETGQATIRFKSGVTGTISAGWVEPSNPVGLLVSGTEGHAAMFNERLYLRTKKVEGADGARPWGKLPLGPSHPLLQLLDAIGGKKDQPLVTVREAAARVKVMEALYQAAREKKWVAV